MDIAHEDRRSRTLTLYNTLKDIPAVIPNIIRYSLIQV